MSQIMLSPLQFPWVIYALDQAAISLERCFGLANLAAVERQVFLLTNHGQADVIQAQVSPGVNLSIQQVPPEATKEEIVCQVSQLLSIAPFVLVVDALPTGRYGELAESLSMLSSIPKILILRDFKPEFLLSQNLRHMIATHYDLAIMPGLGEGSALADLPNVIETAPWVPASSDGRGAIALRKAAAAECADAIVLVLASGETNELAVYGYIAATIAEQCPGVMVRCLAPTPPPNCDVELWDAHWPVIDYVPAADLVIGSGDYSSVHLCQSLDISLIAFPWAREDDLQRGRLEKIAALNDSVVQIVTSAEDALCSAFNLLNHRLEKTILSLQKQGLVADQQQLADGNCCQGTKVGLRLIEEAIENKWNQVAYAAMSQDVDQLRGRLRASSGLSSSGLSSSGL